MVGCWYAAGCCCYCYYVEIYKFNNKLVDILVSDVKQMVAHGVQDTKVNETNGTNATTVHNINIMLKHLTLWSISILIYSNYVE